MYMYNDGVSEGQLVQVGIEPRTFRAMLEQWLSSSTPFISDSIIKNSKYA